MKKNISENKKLNEENENLPAKKSVEELFAPTEWSQKNRFLQEASALPMIISIVIILIIAGSLGFFFYEQYQDRKEAEELAQKNSIMAATAAREEKNEAKEESERQAETQAEPQKEEKKPSELKVAVLNGGAMKGAAAKAKTSLEAKGYTNVEAKNSQGDYTGTTLFYSAGLLASAESLKEKIKTEYADLSTKEAASSEEKSADLVLILGK